MSESPKISVIVAVYNGAQTLQQCVDSVMSQIYTNKELIIIDGGSTDGTVALLEKNEDKLAYWVSEPDKGIADAWNKGVINAQGEWIYFLGADDYLWNETVLTQVAEKLANLPADIRIAYGHVMMTSQRGQPLRLLGKSWKKAKRQIKQKMALPHQAIMHKNTLFKEHGLFDQSFRIAADYDLVLRELKNKDAAYLGDIVIAGMRVGGISNDIFNFRLMLNEYRRAQKRQGFRFPGFYWIKAKIRAEARIFLCDILGESKARSLMDFGRKMVGKSAYWTQSN